jgi:hypothetical protein
MGRKIRPLICFCEPKPNNDMKKSELRTKYEEMIMGQDYSVTFGDMEIMLKIMTLIRLQCSPQIIEHVEKQLKEK